MRREIPLLITGLVGVAFVVQYFVPHPPFGDLSNWFSDWFSIIQACAIVLGVLNLMKISIQSVFSRKEDWFYSIVIIATFALMVIAGLGAGQSYGEAGTVFDWMYRNAFIPLSSTMFALLAFFVASASYRAFRARNFEATLLLVAAFFAIVTLPVEFDASSRAIKLLAQHGIVTREEQGHARAVLNAAALTYVAAALMAIMTLVRMLILRNSRD